MNATRATLTIRYDELDGLLDVNTGVGMKLELTRRDDGRFFFHGISVEGQHNLGMEFDAIDGVPLPEGLFTEWLRGRLRDVGVSTRS